jgi:hypothetical protein
MINPLGFLKVPRPCRNQYNEGLTSISQLKLRSKIRMFILKAGSERIRAFTDYSLDPENPDGIMPSCQRSPSPRFIQAPYV